MKLVLAILILLQPPLPADKSPVETDKPQPEYRLVMLTAKWCGSCQTMKDRLRRAGFHLSDTETTWVRYKLQDGSWDWKQYPTDVLLIDVDVHRDEINGRRDKRIPQFELRQRVDGEWIPVRTRVGGFKVQDFRKLWPELKKSEPKSQRA